MKPTLHEHQFDLKYLSDNYRTSERAEYRRKRSAQAGTDEGVKDGRPQGRDNAGRGSSVHDSLHAHRGSATEVSQSDLAAPLSSANVVGRTQREKQLPSYKAAKSPRPLKSSGID